MNADTFLERVRELGDLADRDEADRWAMAVLAALRDLIADPARRRHFLSQLPGPLKARLLVGEPRAYAMDWDALIQRVAAALDARAPEGARAVRVVYRVLEEAISPGQLRELEAELPRGLVACLEASPPA